MWHTRKKNMERNVKTSTFISACIIKAYQNHVSIIANFLLWGMRKVSLPILSLCPTGLTASRSCKKGRRSRKPFFYPLLKGADLSQGGGGSGRKADDIDLSRSLGRRRHGNILMWEACLLFFLKFECCEGERRLFHAVCRQKTSSRCNS